MSDDLFQIIRHTVRSSEKLFAKANPPLRWMNGAAVSTRRATPILEVGHPGITCEQPISCARMHGCIPARGGL